MAATTQAPLGPTKIAQDAISTHAKTGGSTFDPRTGHNLAGSRNIAVGIAPEHAVVTKRPPTPADHDQFTAAHHEVLAKHAHAAVGTSYDPDSGLHHMEIVGLTPSKTAALEMASHLGENHAYNLANDEKIPTNAQGGFQGSHLNVEQRLDHLREASPKREPYSGTHFSAEKLDMIHGSRRGSPQKGAQPDADAARVRLGTKTGMGKDAPAGFYSHKEGSIPDAGTATKPHAYAVRGQFAFASTTHPAFQQGYAEGSQHAAAQGATPDVAHKIGLNHAEHALSDAGFDGYTSPTHPNMRFHFGSHEAVPVAAHKEDPAGRH